MIEGMLHAFPATSAALMSNSFCVTEDQQDIFLKNINVLRTTTDAETFSNAWDSLRTMLPNLIPWLEWWIRPEISTMIFPFSSKMKTDLTAHNTRTTNATESYHNRFYQLFGKTTKRSIAEGLENLIHLMQKGETDMNVKEKGHSVRHGKSKSEKYENDGRAPDTTKRLSKALKTRRSLQQNNNKVSTLLPMPMTEKRGKLSKRT